MYVVFKISHFHRQKFVFLYYFAEFDEKMSSDSSEDENLDLLAESVDVKFLNESMFSQKNGKNTLTLHINFYFNIFIFFSKSSSANRRSEQNPTVFASKPG